MIVEMLLNVFAFAIRLPFKLLPPLPNLPPSMIGLIDGFMATIVDSIAFVQYIYGFEFFNSVFVFGIAMLTFYVAYYIVLWVIKKIPGGMD